PHDHHAVAVVVVDVVVAVDVPHVRALSARDVDGVWWPRLPRRRDPAGQVRLGLLAIREASEVLLVEGGDLAVRQLRNEVEVDLHDAGASAHGVACSTRSSMIWGNDATARERWPCSSESRGRAAGIWAASHSPCANGTILSCRPCHRATGASIAV